MRKAFLFDLDGVLIDDETTWEEHKIKLYHQLLGEEAASRLGRTAGINLDGIYERAAGLGLPLDKETFTRAMFAIGPTIYREAPIPEGTEDLGKVLLELGFSLGIVSASPKEWIDIVVDRLPFADKLEVVLSLYHREDIPHKPAPDGYQAAMKQLGVSPEQTIVLEDSNTGIQSAKAAGAFTIGLKENLLTGYKQTGADEYAEDMLDVERIVKQWVKGR